jgi:hypothetical protein
MFGRLGLSKLANILFARELQKRLDEEDISIISTVYNPGPTATDGAQSIFPGWLWPVLRLLLLSVEKGSRPAVYLAAAPEIKRDAAKYKGQYFNVGCKTEAPSKLGRDEVLAKNLWKLSEEAVGNYLKN